MNGKTHQLMGFASSLAVSTIGHQMGVMPLPICAAVIAGSCLGSYVPDMDHPGSTLGRRIAIISHPINLLSKMFMAIHKKTKGKISLKLGELFAHRGIFHAPLFWAVVMTALTMYLPGISNNDAVSGMILGILIGISIGIGMHLFADMFNPTGIPLFAPFWNKKFRLGRIVTGSKAEWLVLGVCAVFVVCNVVYILA